MTSCRTQVLRRSFGNSPLTNFYYRVELTLTIRISQNYREIWLKNEATCLSILDPWQCKHCLVHVWTYVCMDYQAYRTAKFHEPAAVGGCGCSCNASNTGWQYVVVGARQSKPVEMSLAITEPLLCTTCPVPELVPSQEGWVRTT